LVQNGNVGGGVKTLKLLFPAKKETTCFVGVALCLDFVICWCVLLRVGLALVLWRWVCEVEPKSEVLGCVLQVASPVASCNFFHFSVSSFKFFKSLKVQFLAVWLDDELNQKIKFHLVSTIIRC